MIGAVWLAVKAWGVWGRIGRGAVAVWAWIDRNPALGALCSAGVALLFCWHVIDVRGRTIARLTAQANAFRAAQVEAGRLAQEALHHQEAVYQAKAQDADHAHQTELADARAAADAYIASHRVRAADVARGAGTTIAGAAGGGAAVPAPMPADAVVVSERDVQACTGAVTYAIAAHNWAAGIDPP